MCVREEHDLTLCTLVYMTFVVGNSYLYICTSLSHLWQRQADSCDDLLSMSIQNHVQQHKTGTLITSEHAQLTSH